MSTDDMNNQSSEGSETAAPRDDLLSVGQSRRKFLRTAVIGTAGVAGAAGVAGVVLAQRNSLPGLLPIAAISGVSQSDYTMLFEDTDCGTNGNADSCGDYSTTNFTVNSNGKATNPGSFFIVLAIRSLPAGTYSLLAQEKLSTASSYSNVPEPQPPNTTTPSLPFNYQSSGSNVQVYTYNTGTITGSGPYALTASPYNSPNNTYGIQYANGAGDTFTTSSTQDVLIFIHVSWNGGTIGSTNATETIDFQITISDGSGTATETTSTTGVQA